jgi:hypothetical protein
MIWAAMLVIGLALLALTIVWIVATNEANELMWKIQDDLMRDTLEHWGKRVEDETQD